MFKNLLTSTFAAVAIAASALTDTFDVGNGIHIISVGDEVLRLAM